MINADVQRKVGSVRLGGTLHLLREPASEKISLCGRVNCYQTMTTDGPGGYCRRCRNLDLALKLDPDLPLPPAPPVPARSGGSALRRAYLTYQAQARDRGYPFALSEEEFARITQLPCVYCAAVRVSTTRLSKSEFRYNGIDRIDNAKGYVEGNMAPCCRPCNLMKGTRSHEEFLAHIQRVAAHCFPSMFTLVNEAAVDA